MAVEVFVYSVVGRIVNLCVPLVIALILDKVLPHAALATLDALCLALLGAMVVEGTLAAVANHVNKRLATRFSESVLQLVGARLSNLPLGYYEQHQLGSILATVSDVDKIRMYIKNNTFRWLLEPVFFAIFMAAMCAFSVWMALFYASVLFVHAAYIIFTSHMLKRVIKRRSALYSERNSLLADIIRSSTTMKSHSMLGRAVDLWLAKAREHLEINESIESRQAYVGIGGDFIARFSIMGIYWIGAYQVVTQSLSVGGFIGATMMMRHMTGVVQRLIPLWNAHQEAVIQKESLHALVEAPVEDTANGSAAPAPPLRSVKTGQVVFDAVSFSYAPGPEASPALEFSLAIPLGGVVAIRGTSGVGKTTMLKLLARLYAPTSGRIMLDGMDVRDIPLAEYRRRVLLVTHDAAFLNLSVADNFRLLRPSASRSDIRDALHAAAAGEFVDRLPQGIDTIIGESGVRFSAGQRQRLAIARALLSDADILLLDEVTSSLDKDTEFAVLHGITGCRGHRTLVMVSHRDAASEVADTVVDIAAPPPRLQPAPLTSMLQGRLA
ncbi:hypothetical protein TSH100_15310 [Azospirillum sp. TSH100]|uniref:peptidase domain-containing ABC transporter n=1 Tax=Azospirillum sp. TSH100 TaxID=652764 RepID=UPI000D6114AF|nr:ATP-binding cassette domain-containing protein [Azospirillum sp. TSH100]PWC85515.1 hypothetical protein TSH100_15310 [Azospirillum sp. TSH100]